MPVLLRLEGAPGGGSRIYRAETAEAAAKRLSEFDAGPWGKKYPMIAESWRRNWEQITPFYSYPPEVRKIIYTTNAIESLHMQLRKVLKNRGHFPSDEAATKVIYLALRNITKSWTNPPLTWGWRPTNLPSNLGRDLTNEADAFGMGATRPHNPRLDDREPPTLPKDMEHRGLRGSVS